MGALFFFFVIYVAMSKFSSALHQGVWRTPRPSVPRLGGQTAAITPLLFVGGYNPERLWHPRSPHITGFSLSSSLTLSPTHCPLTSIVLLVILKKQNKTKPKTLSCETLARYAAYGPGNGSLSLTLLKNPSDGG